MVSNVDVLTINNNNKNNNNGKNKDNNKTKYKLINYKVRPWVSTT